MPTISMFYGILVMMYYLDTDHHHEPHIHVEYGEFKASLRIPNGEILSGSLPPKKLTLVQAWMAIHEDELLADWTLAVRGEPVFKIDPLH